MKNAIFILLLIMSNAGYCSGERLLVAYLAFTDGYWQVWVMNDDGSKPRQVTSSGYDKSRVSWYPDGGALLVCGNQGELMKLSLNSGTESELQLPLEGIQDAVLSPDGKQITFSLSTSGSIDDNNIWLYRLDDGSQEKITNMPALQHDPAWSPNGDRIYFLSGEGGQTHDIWSIDLETRSREQLTSSHLYHFDVAVSPKGVLAFSSNGSGNYEIWLRNPDGTYQQVTEHPANDAKPAWIGNDTLLFESSRSGYPQIWRVNLGQNDPVQLTQHERGARAPVAFVLRGDQP